MSLRKGIERKKKIILSNRNAPLWGVQGSWSTPADDGRQKENQNEQRKITEDFRKSQTMVD